MCYWWGGLTGEVMNSSGRMKKRVLLKGFAFLLLASVALCFAGCHQEDQTPPQTTTGAATSTNADKPAKAPEHPEHPK
jgi:hypothetical protein